MGEVTHVEVRKGANRERVKRHVISVIPFMQNDKDQNLSSPVDVQPNMEAVRPKRKAAEVAKQKLKDGSS